MACDRSITLLWLRSIHPCQRLSHDIVPFRIISRFYPLSKTFDTICSVTSMQDIQTQYKGAKGHAEAWLLGSRISSLASAFYLITKSDIRPCNIRVLDQAPSLEQATHKNSDESTRSIHSLFTCPVGSPMNELLSAIPSGQGAGRPLVFPGHTEQPLSKHR